MESCSPSPRAPAERTKSLLLRAAAASSKPRKPSSASKPSARLYSPTSKIPVPPHSERKADIEPAVSVQGLPFPKSGETFSARHETLRKEKAIVKDEVSKNEKDIVADKGLQSKMVGIEDEALKEIEAVAEDEFVGTEKVAAKNGALSEEMFVYIDEALREAGIQSGVSPLQEINQNDIAEKENTKGHDCAENNGALVEKEEKKGESAETSVTDKSRGSLVAIDMQEDGAPFDPAEKEAVSLVVETEGTNKENALTNFLKVSAQQDPSSPVAETKTVVYSEQNPKFSACTGQTTPGCPKMEGEHDVKQSGRGLIFTEHLDSEQEGFLFAKGEPIFMESIQNCESLPAVECSTLKRLEDQDVPSLSRFGTAVIAASDLKAAPDATVLDLACNGISSIPSSENMALNEAEMIAHAEDVKCPAVENVHCMSVAWPTLSCPWTLSRRALVIPSLVVPALLCFLCFASAFNQDQGVFLHPT